MSGWRIGFPLMFIEINKAFRGQWFAAAFALSVILATGSAIGAVSFAYEDMSLFLRYRADEYANFSGFSCFKWWLGVDRSQALSGVFYFLLPLLASLPYSWSVSVERRSGYSNTVFSRTERGKYYVAKCVATFASGGAVAAVPLLLNFVICACMLPALTPDIVDVVYTGVFEEAMLSELFYTIPLLYVALLASATFLFSGLWAVAVSALSLFVRNRIVYTVAPFLSLVLLEYLNITILAGAVGTSLTPFEFLRGSGGAFAADGRVLLVACAFLFAFSAASFLVAFRRDAL